MSSKDKSTSVIAKRLLFLLCVFMIPLLACGLGGLPETLDENARRIDNTLKDAIRSLEISSKDWARVVEETRTQLIAEGHIAIAQDLDRVLQRGITASGVEFRCNVDFIGERMKEELTRLRNSLLGRETVVPPTICKVDPLSIELSDRSVPLYVNSIQIAGYNLDVSPQPQILLAEPDGLQNVTYEAIDNPSPYYMTLNLGANGIRFTSVSQRLLIRWNGGEQTIGVIQPHQPLCQTRTETIPGSQYTYRPPHTRGDKEFSGHGPRVWVKVSLSNHGTDISATIHMQAKETKEDWTTAEGNTTIPLYTAPSGYRIKQLLVSTEDEMAYTDDSNASDDFQRASGGPVAHYNVVGDTESGNDAGDRTQVTVTFNPLHIELEQANNCIRR